MRLCQDPDVLGLFGFWIRIKRPKKHIFNMVWPPEAKTDFFCVAVLYDHHYWLFKIIYNRILSVLFIHEKKKIIFFYPFAILKLWLNNNCTVNKHFSRLSKFKLQNLKRISIGASNRLLQNQSIINLLNLIFFSSINK